MESFNNIVETEVISQTDVGEITQCCYKRVNTHISDFLQKDCRKFPDKGGLQVQGNESFGKETIQLTHSTFEDIDKSKYRVLLNYENAPEHLQFNPYIRSGYRTFLPTKICLESIFWWTNETVNIWSHIFGWFLFIGLTINDIQFLQLYAAITDKVIIGTLLISFQICMLLSSVYHIFSCRSANDYEYYLTYDLLGIALSLLAIYISGVYYAFWCHEVLRNFYTLTVIAIFIIAMVIQIPRLNISPNTKMCVFVAWAAYGFIPTIHWIIEMGGFQHPMVKLLFPRVMAMYLISGIAFLIYITKIPERWFAGKLDYCGHSHNWWHLFVLVALYHWHNTGMRFAIYMIENDCIIDREKCYRD